MENRRALTKEQMNEETRPSGLWKLGVETHTVQISQLLEVISPFPLAGSLPKQLTMDSPQTLWIWAKPIFAALHITGVEDKLFLSSSLEVCELFFK